MLQFNLDPENQEYFRKFIRDAISAEVVSIVREQFQNTIDGVIAKKIKALDDGNLDTMIHIIIEREVRAHVTRVVPSNYSFIEIRRTVKEEIEAHLKEKNGKIVEEIKLESKRYISRLVDTIDIDKLT